jgi:uncharacterized protein (TIGR03000 family)
VDGGFHGGHATTFHGGHVDTWHGGHVGDWHHGWEHEHHGWNRGGWGYGGLGYYGAYPYYSGAYPYYSGGSYGAYPDYYAPDYSYPDIQPYVATPDYSGYSSPQSERPASPSVPSTTTDTTAHLDVMVPDSAQVWVEGAKTQQTGSLRHFVSPALTPGQDFTYDIRARWTDENGNVVDRTRHVPVHAGGQVMVNFMDSVASK